MEPQTPAARARWLEATVEGLAHEIVSLRAQLGALSLPPPPAGSADRALLDLLVQQLHLLERQCALVHAELARLRADLTGEAAPDREPPDPEPPPEPGAPDAPEEP